MPRITAAERKRREAEERDRAVYAALAWPQEPCPQRYTQGRMDELSGDEHTPPVQAWTFNHHNQDVLLGCFSRFTHSKFMATDARRKGQGGPWYATEAEARLAMRWAVCREMAETLHRLVEAEARAVVAAATA